MRFFKKKAKKCFFLCFGGMSCGVSKNYRIQQGIQIFVWKWFFSILSPVKVLFFTKNRTLKKHIFYCLGGISCGVSKNYRIQQGIQIFGWKVLFLILPRLKAPFSKKTHPKRLFLDVWKVYYGDVFGDDTGIVKTLCTSLKLLLFPTILKLKWLFSLYPL